MYRPSELAATARTASRASSSVYRRSKSNSLTTRVSHPKRLAFLGWKANAAAPPPLKPARRAPVPASHKRTVSAEEVARSESSGEKATASTQPVPESQVLISRPVAVSQI